MNIKPVDELSMDECFEHLQIAEDDDSLKRRFNALFDEHKKFNPTFISKEDFYKSFPGYSSPRKIFLGMFTVCGYHCMNYVYDIEDTGSEIKIVRAYVSKMGIYRFSNNRIRVICPLIYDNVMHIGEGSYLLTADRRMGIINVLSKTGTWIVPMGYDKLEYKDGLITIKHWRTNVVIKTITPRGFKYED